MTQTLRQTCEALAEQLLSHKGWTEILSENEKQIVEILSQGFVKHLYQYQTTQYPSQQSLEVRDRTLPAPWYTAKAGLVTVP